MRELLFVEYPKCSTCQKAKKWLEEHQKEFVSRHIVEESPSFEELKKWYKRGGKDLKCFFNTSGLVYKNLGLKDKLPKMSEDEQLKVLSSNGMLVKRPLIIAEDFVLIGFREAEWQSKL